MRVLITGWKGFIGKNLSVRLGEFEGYEVIGFGRGDTLADLEMCVKTADAVIHLAGVNRPKDESEFVEDNTNLTRRLCEYIAASSRKIPLIVASSIQVDMPNPYGESKRAAEEAAIDLANCTGNPVIIFRLPNVFGKWCRPNYNSVVATFCHNIANNLPVTINNASTVLTLVYIDEVVDNFLNVLNKMTPGLSLSGVDPVYCITLGELAAQIEAFNNCRTSLVSERVSIGLVRALYATYVSYLPPTKFTYDLPCYRDERGVFVEMLKTLDSGQFSFFTAYPGVTRGGHYHHTKTEKFLVSKGSARFSFRHIITGEIYEVFTSGEKPQVVETIPGWTHAITNVGDTEMIVMLWANELLDHFKPDTVVCKV